MKVTDIIVTKHEGKANTYQARIECNASQTVNIALPTFTSLGMTDKINTGTAKVLTTVERKHIEAVTVEVTKEQARELVDDATDFYGKDEMRKRYEHQSENVTIIRL